MSGWAFLISSSRTTEYGALRTALGQQAALVEAHIAWRRTDEARDRVRFHVFARIIAQELHAHGSASRAGQLRLAHAGGAIEKEGARGPLTLPQARTRTHGDGAHGLLHGFFLPKDDLA